jgi:UDP-glucose 4-epimerase
VRVVVTGACGLLGQMVARQLRARGIDVTAVDRLSPREAFERLRPPAAVSPELASPGAGDSLRYQQADLADLRQVYSTLAEATAVRHLGAIASPVAQPPEVVFRNNVLAQFNVCEAADRLGIRRLVSASSVSALGFPWQRRWSEPLYFPLDEAHPLVPQDPYGFSKAVGEDILAAFCRRGAGSGASLRFSTIMTEDRYASFVEHVRRDVEAQAPLLWSYVDRRDAARACLLALEAPFEGHVPVFITSADTSSDQPTAALLDRCFPQVPRRSPPEGMPFPDRWSLLDGRRAREVLDYSPQYHWPGELAVRSGDGPDRSLYLPGECVPAPSPRA